jgi:hypothetical protein
MGDFLDSITSGSVKFEYITVGPGAALGVSKPMRLEPREFRLSGMSPITEPVRLIDRRGFEEGLDPAAEAAALRNCGLTVETLPTGRLRVAQFAQRVCEVLRAALQSATPTQRAELRADPFMAWREGVPFRCTLGDAIWYCLGFGDAHPIHRWIAQQPTVRSAWIETCLETL